MIHINAIILAAGASTRMGQPKMLMPWGKTTVLGHVIDVLRKAEINEILLVTNKLVFESFKFHEPLIKIDHSSGMLASLKAGLSVQKDSAEAILICLGDQPQIEERSVRSVCAAFLKNRANLVVPSYQMRRGHPWLVARPLWPDVKNLPAQATMRDLLNAHAEQIEYVELSSDSVLQDLDTPEDYLKYRPSL